jgi:cell division septation protein DedD
MDETTQRRLVGAAILFFVIFVLASWLPNRNSGADGDERGADAELEAVPDSAPKVVVYDLNTPARKPAPVSSPAAPADIPATPKPIAPVLTLETPTAPVGNSLGWFVQLGSYATRGSAQAALERITQAGFNGTVQEMLKDKKKLFRARIGPFASNAEALQAQQAAIGQGFSDARLVEIWKP